MPTTDYSFIQYQGLADLTAKYRKTIDDLAFDTISPTLKLSYATLGLVGEAGEIANKVKKVIRDQNLELKDSNREDLAKELGDVLWYCSAIATELGYDLGEIARGNIDKLRSRAERGTLGGSGDNR